MADVNAPIPRQPSAIWPELCGCCDQIYPSCLCACCCVPCFASQIGSHAGWNPSWCGCHQEGPRPPNLCNKIAVKFLVLSIIGLVFGAVASAFEDWNEQMVKDRYQEYYKNFVYCDTVSGSPTYGCPGDCLWSYNSDSCAPPAYYYQSVYYPGYISYFLDLISFICEVWVCVLLFHLRRYLRKILWSGPDTCCEDCCCTVCCTCCTVAQEARLVFDYEKNPQFLTCSCADPGPMTIASAPVVSTAMVTMHTTAVPAVTAAPAPVVMVTAVTAAPAPVVDVPVVAVSSTPLVATATNAKML